MDAPALSAEVIFSFYLKIDRLQLLLSHNVLSDTDKKNIIELIKRRAEGEPLAYIVGEKEFFNLSFRVNSSTLIPRPETETIIEVVSEVFSPQAPFLFVDCGAGCGNICITLLKRFPASQGVAIEVSYPAIEVLVDNVILHKVDSRLFVLQGNLLSAIKEDSVDLVVSNPPYLSPLYVENIQKEVLEFEPSLALFGGEKGYEICIEIIKDAFRILKKGGYLIMEMDQYQILHLKEIFPSYLKWKEFSIHKDFAGKERVILLKKDVR